MIFIYENSIVAKIIKITSFISSTISGFYIKHFTRIIIFHEVYSHFECFLNL
ncbi:hypothetical protein GFV14_00546 [Candidatus Hartigia pinicola]|nr:hypothetical protein GFV14_00546 [Candidatus Hartigia pinicola]